MGHPGPRCDDDIVKKWMSDIRHCHKTTMKNQIYNKIGGWVLTVGTMIILAASCVGQDAGTNGSHPHFPGQGPGEKQAILRQIKGTVSAFDSKGMTLTVKSAEGERTFKVTSKTKFTRNSAPASMNEVAVGKPVEVVVKMVYGQPDEISKVDIKSP